MTEFEQPRARVILVAEDNPGDQRILRRVLGRMERRVQLIVVGDGEQALDYLFHRGAFADPETAPRPDLVLLDLNMPRIGGHAVARELRSDPRFARIPLVALTTSRDPEDIEQAYANGFHSYIAKPQELETLTRVLEVLQRYWFDVVELP